MIGREIDWGFFVGSHGDWFLKIGYLRITDFGIARSWRPENAHDTSGTPGYMGIYWDFETKNSNKTS